MMTQDRDLHTGTPIWADEPKPTIPYQHLTKNISTDILIIGAGVSGAMMAEALSEHKFDITIVDRRPPVTGSTAASTALVQYEIDTPLIHLSSKIGKEKAIDAWRRSRLGVENLSAKIRELKMDCAYERRDGLYIAGNILNPAELKQEWMARKAAGLHGQYLLRPELKSEFGIIGPAAILSRDNIACNPVQMAAGFLNKAIERGAVLYSPVQIDHVKRVRQGFIATSSEGFSIKARIVIYLTGYEIPENVPHKKHKIHSTWALSTKPVSGLPERFPFIWQAADPYFYGRTSIDGRMIFGGEDEEFSDEKKRDALIPKKIKALEKKLKKLLPDYLFETEHVWAGSFGGSTTGLPSIGRVPEHKNLYSVMAYGGNGITFSRIAAEIITADILGYKDPEADLFSFKKS